MLYTIARDGNISRKRHQASVRFSTFETVWGIPGLAVGKVLGGGEAAKRAVRSVVVAEVLERVEDRIDRLDIGRQVVGRIELVATCAVQRSTTPFIFGDFGGST